MTSVAPGDVVTEMALEELEESDKQGCPGHYRLYHWEILVGLAVAEYKDPVLRNNCIWSLWSLKASLGLCTLDDWVPVEF